MKFLPAALIYVGALLTAYCLLSVPTACCALATFGIYLVASVGEVRR